MRRLLPPLAALTALSTLLVTRAHGDSATPDPGPLRQEVCFGPGQDPVPGRTGSRTPAPTFVDPDDEFNYARTEEAARARAAAEARAKAEAMARARAEAEARAAAAARARAATHEDESFAEDRSSGYSEDDEDSPAPRRSSSSTFYDEDDSPSSSRSASRSSDDSPSQARSSSRSSPSSSSSRSESERVRYKPVTPLAADEPVVVKTPEPTPKEAGRTWLSNDDAMSLASAQRVLWALERGTLPQRDEVRPHEFLNYFGFHTAPVTPGDTFSIVGDAVRTDATHVSLAFAVQGATPERRPLDLTLLLDRSGSMEGEGRMDWMKRALRLTAAQLRSGDRLDVVLFDNLVCTPLQNFVVGRDDPELFAAVADHLLPRGSTNLDLGLRSAYRVATERPAEPGRNRRVLLVTDAELNTGEVNPALVSEVGRAYEEADVRLTAVGVGDTFRDGVLDPLTEKGKGAYVYLGSAAMVDRLFGAEFAALTQTIAHDVHIALDLPKGLSVERFYGEEASSDAGDVQPVHFSAGRSQLLLQDVVARGKSPSTPLTLTLTFTDPATRAERRQVYSATLDALLAADPTNVDKGQALMAFTDLVLARHDGTRCGEAWSTWHTRASKVTGDAELNHLGALVDAECLPPPLQALKIKFDTDESLKSVALECAGGVDVERAFTAGDTVARFDVPAGRCSVAVKANRRYFAAVTVPSVPTDVRCRLREGTLECG